MTDWTIGIIGGSGLYALEGLTKHRVARGGNAVGGTFRSHPVRSNRYHPLAVPAPSWRRPPHPACRY